MVAHNFRAIYREIVHSALPSFLHIIVAAVTGWHSVSSCNVKLTSLGLARDWALCYLFLLGIEESADKCPFTTPSGSCHVGLRHMCNDDVDCINGTFCCFTGCRRQCWDPVDRYKAISKRTEIKHLVREQHFTLLPKLLRLSITRNSRIQSPAENFVLRYSQSNARCLHPAADYGRALFRCVNCAQRFDYRKLGSNWKLGVKNAFVGWALNFRVRHVIERRSKYIAIITVIVNHFFCIIYVERLSFAACE